MRKQESVVCLDPIDHTRKKQDSPIGRFFKTRPHGGKGITKTFPFGHYLFTGKQRSGKTLSAIWYAEYLSKYFTRKGKNIYMYSNMGFGKEITKYTLSETIRKIEYNPDIVHIFIVDEIQSYFPKDTKDKSTLAEIDRLTGDFSQLGKRQIIVLSTAQVYGRVNKNLREQCLYMVFCRKSKITNKIVNDFIDGDDIMCDDLGRWAGVPQFIHTHGLPTTDFDTHRMITV